MNAFFPRMASIISPLALACLDGVGGIQARVGVAPLDSVHDWTIAGNRLVIVAQARQKEVGHGSHAGDRLVTGNQYGAGQTIFAEGDLSERAYIIEAGEVEIHKEIGGKRVTLARLGPGGVFGEMGLVDERPRWAGATASRTTTLRSLSKQDFVDELLSSPDDALAYVSALLERLRTTTSRLDPEFEQPGEVGASLGHKLRLLPTNKATIACLPEGGLVIHALPFRVGRIAGGQVDGNHLALFDHKPYTVSRNHFVVEREGDGYVVSDLGSFLGTR